MSYLRMAALSFIVHNWLEFFFLNILVLILKAPITTATDDGLE